MLEIRYCDEYIGKLLAKIKSLGIEKKYFDYAYL